MHHPDIFPVNYAVLGDVAGSGAEPSVVFRTAEGTKLAAAVLGVAVAFEVDGYDPDEGEAWSVVIKGHAEEIEQIHGGFDPETIPLFPWNAAPKHRFVRIRSTEITGRRFLVVADTQPQT
jgi:nitroimidazol reductase NimA-like FMN-containing flavoprotein (pyridoxamine 5'-phosphate oxidase superfamily)